MKILILFLYLVATKYAKSETMYNNNNYKNANKNNKTAAAAASEQKPRGPFSSNVMGAPIVNAITGVKYPWKVGSYGETFLWKVVNCTHFDPKLYFYDSPEQYEAYKNAQIDPEAKFEWHRLQQRVGHLSE